jgi:hypothetical protein
MLGFVEDERTFFMHAFMKGKLHNRLGLHLDTITCMFAQEFYTQKNFLNQEAIAVWKDQKM